ncbi:E3 ubiquitin-protein ligase RNF34-like [Mercenaria mercenaria]|uniref:E3 ubiquitin-protein ligase RNF34-like n=1 Tax=Mercenaria mercenaria TaxID=6596 RepID=UPI00234E8EDB|nr:E3 ubiquitin-protein ligase RNF34-like [Mercenaria mercenaria]XP_045172015.2 E3 ubiquitin-protein ligase RNF34-like [Mercenaria mercenaria]
MGAGVVKPEQNGIRIQIHTGRNPANMGNHNSTDLKCEECTSKFSQFRKQLPCKDCGRTFCSVCFVPARKQCKKCQMLLSGNFTRPQLKQWKPKDLKALLHKHDVNTSKCHEKDELIDLIFSYFGSTSRGGAEQERGNSADYARQQNHSQQRSNVAGASQSGYAQSRTETSQEGSATHFNQTRSGSYNQSGTGSQSGYAQSTTGSNQPGSRTSEPFNNNGTQSNQTGSGSYNQSGTGTASGSNNRSEPSEPDEKNEGDMPRIKLEDIKSEEHIEQLSIKCLKRLLLNNFVDYKGCCERWELQERVKRLWNHDQINKQKADQQRKISDDPSLATSTSANSEDDMCKICMDASIDCVLLECGHMVTCTQCGKRLSECPICRQYVVRAVHIFKA